MTICLSGDASEKVFKDLGDRITVIKPGKKTCFVDIGIFYDFGDSFTRRFMDGGKRLELAGVPFGAGSKW